MNTTLQNTITFGALNYAIGILLGAGCFSAFAGGMSIYARQTGAWPLPNASFVESVSGTVWGIVVVFALACIFGTVIFLVPGVVHATVVALLSTRLMRHSDLAVSVLAALLGSVIFPVWLFLYSNPLQKEWPLVSGIAAISCATAAILSLRIVRRTFPPTSVVPPPLPRG